jgi:hypothetical protein
VGVAIYLSKYGLVGGECETQGLRIILQDILDTVVQLLVLWGSCDWSCDYIAVSIIDQE